MNSGRYNKFSVFLKNKFGGRVDKICVDGGFSCPNRDGTSGTGGCIFCALPGQSLKAGASDIRSQVKSGLDSEKDSRAKKFIVYFQDYSNTYASVNELKEKYDAALCDERIVALAIATRPDCITEEIADLIAGYCKQCYVYVEMGLQTSSDITAKKINRGYETAVFSRAAQILYARGVEVVAHVIFALPGETDEDMRRTISFVNAQKISGIKIHSLFVSKNSPLNECYLKGGYIPQSFEEYIARLTHAVTHLRKDIIIHRITGDCQRGQLAAPPWNNRKKLIRNALEKTLETNNWTQGCFL